MSDFRVTLASWVDAEAELASVRDRVFIIEQEVPENLERDPLDLGYIHAVARDHEGQAIATGRLLPDGKIGRMAVLKDWRGAGVGKALLNCLVDAARARGDATVYLEAQVHALGFYEANGFIAEGDEFMDAGIPHKTMRRSI